MRDHQLAREFAKHAQKVRNIRRRAQNWRLLDCDEPTLVEMRHSLIEQMVALEGTLNAADSYFLHCIENSDPVATEDALQQLNRLTAAWQAQNAHLQEIDGAILERHLWTRLITLFRGRAGLYLFEAIILIAIVVVITITLIELLVPTLPPAVSSVFLQIDLGISLFLMFDFGLRWWLSEDRRWYWRRYWVDFVASLPLVSILRFGRLARLTRFARLLRLLRLGRAVRLFTYQFHWLDKLVRTFELKLLKRALIVAVVLLFAGAWAINMIEINTAAGMVDDTAAFSESLWWSFTTLLTGGFADLHNPETSFGRFITMLLVLLGFAITSIFTAALTSVLVGDGSSKLEQTQHQLERDMRTIQSQLDLMSKETNNGLLVLETVSQTLSNLPDTETLYTTLIATMLDHFEALQASVHLLNPNERALHLVASQGVARATPPHIVAMGNSFLGESAAILIDQNLREFDLEPFDAPCLPVRGVALACPLVADGKLLGFLHLVLPKHLGRYYLYNRAPMILAHHAALALTHLNELK